MKKFYIVIMLLLSYAGAVSAQMRNPLGELYSSFSSSCVVLECAYTVNMSQTRISGTAVVKVQDEAYQMVGNGLEVLCDGETVWTMDPVAKEVIIEEVGTESIAFMNNPALLFINLSSAFDVRKETPSEGSIFYELISKVDCGMYGADLTVSDDGCLKRGVFSLTDGNTVIVDVRSMKQTKKEPVTSFRPSSEFDSDWIVTDLR